MEGFEFIRRLKEVSDRFVDSLGDHFGHLATQFDPDTLGSTKLFPWQMTWYYGEPIWHALDEERKLMLNRLCFCQSYLSTAVAEIAVNVLNMRSALSTILQGHVQPALYMAREVVEEMAHVQAFLTVIEKVLGYYGLTLDQLRAANPSLKLTKTYINGHTLLSWLRGNLHYYYFTRFALNVNQKTVERLIIDEPDAHPIVQAILTNHATDEARHMQMSRATGLAALRQMRNPVTRIVACLAYAHFAASIFITRHRRDSRLTRETRIRTLQLVGVDRATAERAYKEWRDRVNQPEDPPLVRNARLYFLRCNFDYIEEMPVPTWVKKRMRAIISEPYRDLGEMPTLLQMRPSHPSSLWGSH
ncbi:MAG: diiron oxygenase [Candidatus Binatia bacterium]|nr:diiron oxygenase [Candidatus Binatia bacterium]